MTGHGESHLQWVYPGLGIPRATMWYAVTVHSTRRHPWFVVEDCVISDWYVTVDPLLDLTSCRAGYTDMLFWATNGTPKYLRRGCLPSDPQTGTACHPWLMWCGFHQQHLAGVAVGLMGSLGGRLCMCIDGFGGQWVNQVPCSATVKGDLNRNMAIVHIDVGRLINHNMPDTRNVMFSRIWEG